MRQKILDKIKKLFAQAEGEKAIGNADAAQAFLEKIQQLLDKHSLSMSDVEIEAERRAEIAMEPVSLIAQNMTRGSSAFSKPFVCETGAFRSTASIFSVSSGVKPTASS